MPFAWFALFQVPPVLPIDLTGLLATFMGISIVLIPVMGLTARFALKPTVEALSRFFERRGDEVTISILERRMALMEAQIESNESNVQRLVEASEFHQKLTAPTEAPAQLPAANQDV